MVLMGMAVGFEHLGWRDEGDDVRRPVVTVGMMAGRGRSRSWGGGVSLWFWL